jgi:putative heme transporter
MTTADEPAEPAGPPPGRPSASDRDDDGCRPETAGHTAAPGPGPVTDGSPPRVRPPASVPVALDLAAQYAWRSLLVLAAAAAVVLALYQLYLVVLPVVVATILATICVPPARRLERAGFSPLLAAMTVVLGGLAVLGGFMAWMAPAFFDQARDLGPTISEGVDRLLDWVEEGPVGWDREQVEDTLGTFFTDGAAARAGRLIGTVGELLAALALTLVLLFFFVKDGPLLTAWITRRLAGRHNPTLAAAASRGWTALGGFVRGTALVALIDAIGIGIGLAVIGVPLVLPLAFLVFLGGFIPVIGAFLTGLLAVLVALAWGGLTPALATLAVVVAVQQVESNLLQPIVMRRAVALHPVVTLSALTTGAVLAGIIGAFLAVPVAAVAAAVGNELRLRREAAEAGLPLSSSPLGGPKPASPARNP